MGSKPTAISAILAICGYLFWVSATKHACDSLKAACEVVEFVAHEGRPAASSGLLLSVGHEGSFAVTHLGRSFSKRRDPAG